MSGADTLTFGKLGLTLGMGAKIAWLIHRLQFNIGAATYALMTTAADYIVLGLSQSAKLRLSISRIPQLLTLS